MEKDLEMYLEKVDKYLKPIPLSERLDIIKEIKSHIEELYIGQGISAQKILTQLEPPKELAKAYLGNSICKSNTFSLAGFSGMFILPIFTVLSGGLKLCAIIAPIAGAITSIGYLLGFEVPFVAVQFGPFTPHPLLSFPLCVILGIVLFFAGRKSWQVVLKYVNTFNKKKKALHRS